MDVDAIDLNDMYNVNDVNVAANMFQCKLLEIVDLHAPFKKLKVWDHAPPWINTEYLLHVDSREFWSRKFKKSPSQLNLDMKTQAIRNAHQLKLELRSYFKDALDSCRGVTKNTWWAIKQFWRYKCKTSGITNINGQITDTAKATEINNLFANIASEFDRKIPVVTEKLPEFLSSPPVL